MVVNLLLKLVSSIDATTLPVELEKPILTRSEVPSPVVIWLTCVNSSNSVIFWDIAVISDCLP